MPAALPQQDLITQAAQGDTEFRVNTIQYGNGYSQRAVDGLNAKVDSWTLDWDNLYESEFESLVTAFDAAGGADYFTWTAPGDSSAKKFIVPKYTRRIVAGNMFSISATLNQVFDL